MVYLTCLCGNKLQKDLRSGGVIVCKRCYRIWVKSFDSKVDDYVWDVDESKLKKDKNFLK